MGCQTDIATRIIEEGGEYILTVKQNQDKLHEEISELFEYALSEQAATEYEKDHGRVESRTCKILSGQTGLIPHV